MTDQDSSYNQSESSPRTARSVMGALAGTAGAAVGLGFGELVEGASESIPSLVVAVSELLSDYTPGDVVRFSIANFGASQKTLLTVGIVVGSLVLGGVLGRLAARGRTRAMLAGFALFGLLGGWAAARNPISPAAGSWIVGLAAAALAAGTTLLLVGRLAGRAVTSPATLPPDPEQPEPAADVVGTCRADDAAGLLRVRGRRRCGRTGYGRPGPGIAGPVGRGAVPGGEHAAVGGDHHGPPAVHH